MSFADCANGDSTYIYVSYKIGTKKEACGLELLDNVHFIKCPLGEAFTGVHIILGKEIVLIDSGLPNAWRSSIRPYLEKINREPNDISLIIHTHGHGDHIGSDAAIRKETNAKIAIHELDALAIEDPDVWLETFFDRYGEYVSERARDLFSQLSLEPLEVDRYLKDGDFVDLEVVKLRVIHTPGHSDGSICLYDESNCVLFSGDSIQARGTVVSDISLVLNLDDYLSSMNRLMEMKIETVLPAHHFKPFDKIILKGSEAKQSVLESIDNTTKMHNSIFRLLQASMSPLTIEKITGKICEQFGTGSAPLSALAQAQYTVASHLSKLVSDGEIGTIEKGSKTLFIRK